MIAAAIGREAEEAKQDVLKRFAESKVAATAFVCAIEVLQDNPLLDVPEAAALPLLTPINALDPAGIEAEVEEWLGQGFRTFKVKVGKDVEADLARVPDHPAGRGRARDAAARRQPRLSAASEGIAFASSLDPVRHRAVRAALRRRRLGRERRGRGRLRSCR